MTHDININGKEWLELIFAEKNKMYGAYAIRNAATRRHISAYFIIMAFASIAISLPVIKKWVAPAGIITTMTEITQISSITLEPPVSSAIQNIIAPPPSSGLRQTIKYVTFKITNHPVDVPTTVTDEINNSNAAISFITQGCDTEGTIFPEDITQLPVEQAVCNDFIYFDGAIEQPAVFRQGDLMKWIYKELRYPQSAIEAHITGRVVLQFVVGKDGKVRDIELIRGAHSLLDNEAMRVLKKMPEWIPGKQNGTAVSVRYVMPIIFNIAGT